MNQIIKPLTFELIPANAPFNAGTRAFSLTLITAGNQTVTATDLTDGTKPPNTSPLTVVNPAPAAKLVIATQPSGSAAAGTAFAQQPAAHFASAAVHALTIAT